MSDAQTKASDFEMAQIEERSAHQVKAWVQAYLDFPTADNFDGLAAVMRTYQREWMNGRRRP